MRRIVLPALALSSALPSAPAGQEPCELAGLAVPEAAASAGLGSTVALSGDTLLAGAPGADGGRAYVFERVAGAWQLVQTLAASDGSVGDGFGQRVDLAGDLAVVGAPFHDGNGADSGAAYVFERVGGAWIETERVVSADNSFGDLFGIGVATDGVRVAVGGCQFFKFLTAGVGNGAAYVFERSGADWVQAAKVEAGDGAPGDRFGVSVDLDGDRWVCGAEDDDDFGPSSGTAYVFDESGGTWGLDGKLVAFDSAGGHVFGFDVSVSGDRVLVGAIGADGAAPGAGAAYVFEPLLPGVWAATAKLFADDGAGGEQLGWSVDLEGDRAAVGAPSAAGSLGAARLFERTAGTWTASDALVATGAPAGAAGGSGVALDGATLAVGASGLGAGAVHVWAADGAGCAPLFAFPGALPAAEGGLCGFRLLAPAAAGDLYVVIGSLTGTSPGLPLAPGVLLPLNPDAYTLLTLGPTPIAAGVGVLDADGAADAALGVPANPALAGLELHHAFATADPLTLAATSASNAEPLSLE